MAKFFHLQRKIIDVFMDFFRMYIDKHKIFIYNMSYRVGQLSFCEIATDNETALKQLNL